MTPEQEKEFFRLAGFFLLSRYQLMGNETSEFGYTNDLAMLELSYLGMQDSALEMQLLCFGLKAKML